MYPGEWKGNNVPETNRILILGESHYDENNDGDVGKVSSYTTAEVVESYLSHRELSGGFENWHRFFDRIAESFGYTHEKSKEFYGKVFFGNYVPVLCGKGDTNKSGYFMNLNRTEYNNELFSFVNQNRISVIVCFTKATFWNLPAASNKDQDTYDEIKLPSIGGRMNKINVYEYASGVKHGSCDIALEVPLKVYGIRHPSAKGGYNSKQVYEVLSREACLQGICLNVNSRG